MATTSSFLSIQNQAINIITTTTSRLRQLNSHKSYLYYLQFFLKNRSRSFYSYGHKFHTNMARRPTISSSSVSLQPLPTFNVLLFIHQISPRQYAFGLISITLMYFLLLCKAFYRHIITQLLTLIVHSRVHFLARCFLEQFNILEFEPLYPFRNTSDTITRSYIVLS